CVDTSACAIATAAACVLPPSPFSSLSPVRCLSCRGGTHRGLRSFPTRRSSDLDVGHGARLRVTADGGRRMDSGGDVEGVEIGIGDRKSTRLNSSHVSISYAVFCLKKKKKSHNVYLTTRDVTQRCDSTYTYHGVT